MYDKLDRAKLIDLTQQLIRIATINPPGINYGEFVQYTSTYLSSIGMEVYVDRVESGRPFIIAWAGRGRKPELHFNGHYDVVPAGPRWSMPPFEGARIGDKIYGRGAADMKGGIAAAISAIKAIIDSGRKLNGCLSISLVPDEETGGELGSKRLVRTDLISPDMVVIPEPTFPRVLLGHKGVIQLLVKVVGTGGHAAMPYYGKNAFTQMIRLAQAIVDHWKVQDGIIQKDISSINDRRALPTLTLGGICSSGEAVNSVPDQCLFSIDRRLNSNENVYTVLDSLESFINQQGQNVEVTKLVVAEASNMVPEEGKSLLKPLQNAISDVLGRPAPEGISTGFMDSRFFRARWNIPCVAYGPGNSGAAHVNDEYVEIEQLLQVSEIFRRLIQTVLISNGREF